MKTSLIILATVLLIIGNIHATTINVPSDQPTIQAGIDAAINGDTVLVHPGTYVENINFNGKDIIVSSLFLTTGDTSYISTTVIDGSQNGSVVKFENNEKSTAILSGFTITNGSAQSGGGIFCHGSSPSLMNMIVIGNAASSGGGIYCQNSNTKLFDVIVYGNIASGEGGGISCYAASPNLVNITIKKNTASSVGGGISSADWSHPDLVNVIICENTASLGGGIYCGLSGNPTIYHSAIYGNSDWGIYNGDDDKNLVQAQNNWWGHSSGPLDNSDDPLDPTGLYNPHGKGDRVTDYVDYSNWLTLWKTEAPNILAIDDVPDDHGRQVNVIWSASTHDDPADANPIVQYSLWRKVPEDLSNPNTAISDEINNICFNLSGLKSGQNVALNDNLWTFINAIPAVPNFDRYSYVAPTPGDSTFQGIFYTTFMVIAHTANPGIYYQSAPASGYSVDNLPYSNEIILTIPSINAIPQDTVLIPINVIFAPGEYYDSAKISIGGYQNGLQFIEIDTASSLIGNAGWNFVADETGSLLKTAYAGTYAISGRGVFCWLKFKVTGDEGTFVPVTIESALFNAGENFVTSSNGGVRINPVAKSLTIGNQFFLTEIIFPDSGDPSYSDFVETITGYTTINGKKYSIIEKRQNGLINKRYERSDSTKLYQYRSNINDELVVYDLNWRVGTKLPDKSKVVENDISEIFGLIKHKIRIHKHDPVLSPNTNEYYEYFQTLGLARYDWVHDYIGGRVIILQGAIINGDVYGDITAINNEEDKNLPTGFELFQNYPNPFNGQTTIEYQIPQAGHVKLMVYNLIGQKICALVDKRQQAGYFKVIWDGKDNIRRAVPSGVYSYRLETKNFSEEKKMILIK